MLAVLGLLSIRLQPDSPLTCLLCVTTAAFFLFLRTQRHTVHTITQQLVRTTSATTTITHTQRGNAASVLPKLLPPSVVGPSVVTGVGVVLALGSVLLSVVARPVVVGVVLVGLLSKVTMGVGLTIREGFILLSVVARSYTVRLTLRTGSVLLSMVTGLFTVGVMLTMRLVLLSIVTESFTVEVEGLLLVFVSITEVMYLLVWWVLVGAMSPVLVAHAKQVVLAASSTAGVGSGEGDVYSVDCLLTRVVE